MRRPSPFPDVQLGPVRTGPIAIASSYGLGARDVERAFERGLGFFWWGALRHRGFGGALRRLAARSRGGITIAVQTFARRPWLLRASVNVARVRLRVDAIDVLGLGYWSAPPPAAVVDAARSLRDRGVVRSLVVSSHDRSTLAALAADPAYDGIMVRYNAAHTGAEAAVLPAALAHHRPVIAYTATRWGTLVGAAPPDEPAPRAADCYRFALTHGAVGACLAGPQDGRELEDVFAALDAGPMSDGELDWMRRAGARVRERARAAPRMTLRRACGHARAIAREVYERGITEEIVSRFNRTPPS